jgi:hypothetical protein
MSLSRWAIAASAQIIGRAVRSPDRSGRSQSVENTGVRLIPVLEGGQIGRRGQHHLVRVYAALAAACETEGAISTFVAMSPVASSSDAARRTASLSSCLPPQIFCPTEAVVTGPAARTSVG